MRTDKNGPIGVIGMDGWDGSSGKFASLQLLSRFEARRETGLLPEIRSARKLPVSSLRPTGMSIGLTYGFGFRVVSIARGGRHVFGD